MRKFKRLGVEIVKGRGEGGHCLARYKGRQTTIPLHGDVDIAGPFLKELCRQPGIDPRDIMQEAPMIYPVTLTEDPETGQVMARCPDVPEAVTVGRDRSEALQWVLDALLVALSGYMDDGRQVPAPSEIAAGQPAVALPALVSAKLAVYEAMRGQRISQIGLAQKLGVDSRQVRRLLDLDHNSRMDQVEAALKALGKRLVISVKEAA